VDREWWYRRLAAVLRKVYVLGPIGSTRLAAEFGGKEDRGSKPYRARRGSRAVARAALKRLEAMGLVTASDGRGRVVSPEGQKLLDDAAYRVLKDMAKEDPELTKYL
jgi:small subunit ribosomal protein S19e